MYGIEFSTNPDQMNNVIEYQVISSEDMNCENKVQILHNCTSCDAYFMDRDVLRRHIGLIHENKIPLECTYCYAVFIEHKKLTQHKVCREPRVSVQGVKSLGGHFAFLHFYAGFLNFMK